MTELNGVDNGVVESVEEISSTDVAEELTDLTKDEVEESPETSSDEDDATFSETDEIRDALLAADDPNDTEDDSDGDPAQVLKQEDEIRVANSVTSQPDIVMVKLDDILVSEGDAYSREKIDSIVVDEYVEVIRNGNGGNFPPVALDRATIAQDKKVLIDGAHRVAAFKKFRQKREKFVDDYKRELGLMEDEGRHNDPLPICPPPAPDEIPARFIDIPRNVPRILVGYSFNKSHGLRPRPQDRAKTSKAAYLENRGIALSTLASYLGVSVKVVRSDIRKLVEEYESLKVAHIAVRGADGATAAEIAAELVEQFPYGKGLSESTIARKLDEMREGFMGRPKKEKKQQKVKEDKGIKKDPDGKKVTNDTGDKGGTPPYPPTTEQKPSGSAPSAKNPSRPKNSSDKKGNDAPSKSAAASAAPAVITANDNSLVNIDREMTIPSDGPAYSLFVNEVKRGVQIVPYDFWRFGNLLTEFIVNLLFFFTHVGDEVVSLMVPQSGSHQGFLPICESMGRKYVAWIEKDGWPKAATSSDLIFVTYPALKRCDTPDYPAIHLEILRSICKCAYENVKNSRLAVLCTEQFHDDTLRVFDYYEIIKSSGWTSISCIPAPIAFDYEKALNEAVRSRTMLHSGRYLIIAEKRVPVADDAAASALSTEKVSDAAVDGLAADSPETDSQTQTVE